MRRFAAAFSTAAAVLVVPAAAAAPGGTWGVGNYHYVDGVVCRSGLTTSPLASWDFGDGGLEFLAQAVTSDGVRDSAALPTRATPGRFTAPVIAGEYGFGSDAQIAAYAELIERYGSTRAADVARAVLDRTDPGGAPSCVSQSAGAGLLAAAARSAGPYDITLTAAHSPAELGAPDSLTVRVTGGSGSPARGVAVKLTADASVFGATASAEVVTGANGTATVPFTAPVGLTATSVGIQAAVTAAVGLDVVSVVSGTGRQFAPALYLDDAQTFTADVDVPIDQAAQPRLTVDGASRAGTVHAPLPVRLHVSGMHGHSGEVQVQVVGPAPLGAGTLCAHPGDSGDSKVAFTSGLVDVVGDQTVVAGTWTPDAVGCYRVKASVTTTDAQPSVTARTGPVVLSVLDMTTTYQPAHTVVGPGPMTGTLAIDHSRGLGGTASIQLRGPARPVSGDCSTVNWSRLAARTVAAFAVRGDQSYHVTTRNVTGVGCYRVEGAVAAALPGGVTARIPLRTEGSASIFLLHPTVTLAADQTWADAPSPVGTHVTVSGTYGQAGRLSVAMLRVAPSPLGCRSVDFAHAARTTVGPAVRFSGDGTYAVPSGRTGPSGCYSLVPTLTMTDNPAITARGRPGLSSATIFAGISPAAAFGAGANGRPLETPRSLAVWPAVIGFVVVLLAVMAWTARVARSARSEPHRPAPGLRLLD